MKKIRAKRKITSSIKIKQKTHSGSKKRFNIGPSKITYMSIGTRHKLIHKINKSKSTQRIQNQLFNSDKKNIMKYFLVNNKSLKKRIKKNKLKKVFCIKNKNENHLQEGGLNVKN